MQPDSVLTEDHEERPVCFTVRASDLNGTMLSICCVKNVEYLPF